MDKFHPLVIFCILLLTTCVSATKVDDFKNKEGQYAGGKNSKIVSRRLALANENKKLDSHLQVEMKSTSVKSEHSIPYLNKFRRGLQVRALGSGPSLATIKSSHYRHESVEAPASVDWRNTRAMTKVFDQGHCDSCWAVATTDAISMMWAITVGEGQLPPLKEGPLSNITMSTQQVCDCAAHPCCQSGMPEWTLEYVSSVTGLVRESDYPSYAERQKFPHECGVTNSSKRVAKITGWELTPARDVEALKKAVAQQPIISLLSSRSKEFEEYESGVFKGAHDGKLDHVVVVVGYGNDSKEGPYWIIKNSWGQKWGENGFMRLAMQEGEGQLGITSSPSMFPVYFPDNTADPCSSFPKPCGSGKCYHALENGKSVARCKCSEGFVENRATLSGSKCVTATPCDRNPNPCGIGSCSNNKDGSFTCSCPKGYVESATSNGLTTCIPGSVGVRTYVVQPNDTCHSIMSANKVDFGKFTLLNGFVDCERVIHPGTVLTLSTEDFSGAMDGVDEIKGAIHRVYEGETCESISKDYLLEMEQFLSLNPSLTCTGQKLTPGSTVLVSEYLKRPEGHERESHITCDQWHRIQHGDHCDSIRQAANLSRYAFSSLNPHFRCDAAHLYIGKKVCVAGNVYTDDESNKIDVEESVPYSVRKGDTLESIALDFSKRCGASSNSSMIRLKNSVQSVEEGQLLRIPCAKGLQGGCPSPTQSRHGCWYCPDDYVCGIPWGNFIRSECDAKILGQDETYKGFCHQCWARCYSHTYILMSDRYVQACAEMGYDRCPAPVYYEGRGCTYRQNECRDYCYRGALNFFWLKWGRWISFCGWSGNGHPDCDNLYGRVNWCRQRCVEFESSFSKTRCYY